MYLLRLDDASEYRDVEKWDRIEMLLHKYNIKPIVGIIPNNQDESLISKYRRDSDFWNRAKMWEEKGWAIALHGYNHVYTSNSGGINPVNSRSEFAGISLEKQRKKIACGIQILQEHKLNTKIFFAPSHTFDMNTLEALKLESDIRIISDTIANDTYKVDDFYFVPQQSGRVRKLPFKLTTYCYHPNTMIEKDFKILESFIKGNVDKFINFDSFCFNERELSIYDKILINLYFSIRAIRNKLKGR